jgi:hypothetical protein
LDIVWGDMSLDVNDTVLGQFDKVGLNAHCSLWRSSDYPELLKLMMEPEWLAQLSDGRFNYALDEHLGLGALYRMHPNVYLFRHDLNLDPHAGWIVPMDYYHRVPNTYFWHNGRLIWRVFTRGGYYDTSHSYLHFQKQPMNLVKLANQEESVYQIRYGAIEAVEPGRCEGPSNFPSRRLRVEAWKRRIGFTIRNRFRGGDRQRVAL